MKTFSVIPVLLACCLSAYGQTDSTGLFEQSKGSWRVPVSRYIRIYNNEELKTMHTNLFDSTLRLITDSAFEVKAVHDGIVIAVYDLTDYYAVVTKFGNYSIVYSGLNKPVCRKGDTIRAGQSFASLMCDHDEGNNWLELKLIKNGRELSAASWFDW